MFLALLRHESAIHIFHGRIFNTDDLKRKRGSTSGSRAESTYAKRKRSLFGDEPEVLSLTTKNRDERIGAVMKAEWIVKKEHKQVEYMHI